MKSAMPATVLAAMPGFDARDNVECVVNDHVSDVGGGNVGNIHLYKRGRFQNVTEIVKFVLFVVTSRPAAASRET